MTGGILGPGKHVTHEDSEHWMSVSDLMSGLMIVFLFISIALMRTAFIERDKIKQVAVAYKEKQVAIYDALNSEFSPDLKRWNASIDAKTLAFEFKSPDILFGTGSSSLRPVFKEVLQDFFPRYLSVLTTFKKNIDEVRIEGHTSSQWNTQASPDDAYFRNMALSQERTRSVLLFVQLLPEIATEKDWVRENLAAVGFSSSKPVLDALGNEDAERSRRVTFRVITNAETQIRRILED